MVETILEFLQTGIGENNVFFLFIYGVIEDIGLDKIIIWQKIIGGILGFLFVIILLFQNYKFTKKERLDLGDFLEDNIIKLLLYSITGFLVIYGLIVYGFLLKEFLSLIIFLTDPNGGIGFLFDTEGKLYVYYNMFRWIVLIIIVLHILYQGITLYYYGETEEGTSKSYLIKAGMTALILFYIVCFSPLPTTLFSVLGINL